VHRTCPLMTQSGHWLVKQSAPDRKAELERAEAFIDLLRHVH
jgi:hypothetical protein